MSHVVVPWFASTGADERRRVAMRYVVDELTERFDSVDLAALCGAEAWCKAQAVMPAVYRAPNDVVVLHDADVWCDPGALELAIERVRDGAGWARPHQRVLRLTQAATERFMLEGPARWLDGRSDFDAAAFARRPYRGEDGGGIVVAHRNTLLDVPLDKRFVGWGQEDSALGAALHTIAGPAWVGRADLFHFWHPPAPRMTSRKGSTTSWALWGRYHRARTRNDREAMRSLLAEAWP